MDIVSIIVPVYNTGIYLSECIESIIYQTYRNIELILINDGSTDDSLSICKKYQEKDSRIIIESTQNKGVSNARNIGLDIAKGRYIMFVDSDDWIEEDNVKLAVENIEKTDADIVIWSFYKNYLNKEIQLSLLPGEDRLISNEKQKEILYLKSIYANIEKQTNTEDVSAGTVMCKLYKRTLLDENNIRFNSKLIRAEDVIFALEAFKNAEKISYFNENLYHYRINDSSICNSFRYIPDTNSPFNLLLEEMNKFHIEINRPKSVKEAIYCRTVQVLLWHLKYHFFHKEKDTNLLNVKKEVKRLISSEPYKTAIREVDTNLIPKQERLMVLFFRRRLVLSYYILQKLISIKNSNKSNKFK